MLKGLKKTQGKQTDVPQPSAVRSSINENQLKRDTIMGQEEDIEPIDENEKNQKEMLALYQQCYDLFLSGKEHQLSEKLKLIKENKHVHHAHHGEDHGSKVVGKFQYDLKFDEEKEEGKKRSRPIMASNRISNYCLFCPDNEQLELLSASNYVYLALPKYKTFKNYFHLILAPVDHEQTMIGLNQDVLTEITNYKKCLLQAFDKVNLQVVFFEQFSQENSHIYIECLAIPYTRAQDLPFFFKQGLEDVEGNWSTHKSIIKIEKEKGGLQKQIPKQIKYFYIDFSQGYGYAHVIQDQKQWKRSFCNQILATALGLQQHLVKTTEQFSEEEKGQKRQGFNKIWSSFDWTQLI